MPLKSSECSQIVTTIALTVVAIESPEQNGYCYCFAFDISSYINMGWVLSKHFLFSSFTSRLGWASFRNWSLSSYRKTAWYMRNGWTWAENKTRASEKPTSDRKTLVIHQYSIILKELHLQIDQIVELDLHGKDGWAWSRRKTWSHKVLQGVPHV